MTDLKEEGLSHRKLLVAHYDALAARANKKKVFKGSSFDLMALVGFPRKDLVFHSTFGLSDFLLEKRDGTLLRQELSWTTRSEGPDERIENILLNLGLLVIDEGKALDAGVALRHLPLATHLGSGTTVATMLTRAGLWLEEPEFWIEEKFPMLIVELAGITQAELNEFDSNPDRLYERFASGEIDVLDMRRTRS